MATPIRSSRETPPGFATSAGALIALVALAAMISSSAAATQRVAESRPTITEAQAVRAVAAAVVRAARELVGRDRIDAAPPVDLVLFSAAAIAPAVASAPAERADHVLAAPRIGERLLNLPPPIC